MKHPGFFRLISALYMLAPCFRLFLASFDVHLVGLVLLRRNVRVSAPVDVLRHVRRLSDGLEHRGALAERPVPEEPAGDAHCDEQEPRVEELERSAEPRPSTRRTCGVPPLRKPGQTTCVALPQAREHRGCPV